MQYCACHRWNGSFVFACDRSRCLTRLELGVGSPAFAFACDRGRCLTRLELGVGSPAFVFACDRNRCLTQLELGVGSPTYGFACDRGRCLELATARWRPPHNQLILEEKNHQFPQTTTCSGRPPHNQPSLEAFTTNLFFKGATGRPSRLKYSGGDSQTLTTNLF